MNRLLKISQVADQLAIQPSTVRKWISQRRLSIVRVGKRAIRIQQGDVDQIIKNGLRPAIEE